MTLNLDKIEKAARGAQHCINAVWAGYWTVDNAAADFINTANPKTVIEMVAELRRLQRELDIQKSKTE